jgi:exonuclease 3'-5' domain-containing protein 2
VSVHKGWSQQRVTKDITFVVTEIAGSAELWEWNAQVMDLALQLHDATLHTLMIKHLGHEVVTEGASFSVVFHDATDALQWCLQVQQVPGPAQHPR